MTISKDNTVALPLCLLKGFFVYIHAIVTAGNQKLLFRIQIRFRQHTGAGLSLRQPVYGDKLRLTIMGSYGILHAVRFVESAIHVNHVASVFSHSGQIPGSADYHGLFHSLLTVCCHDRRFMYRISRIRKPLSGSRHGD